MLMSFLEVLMGCFLTCVVVEPVATLTVVFLALVWVRERREKRERKERKEVSLMHLSTTACLHSYTPT